MPHENARRRGFTLIELMFADAITHIKTIRIGIERFCTNNFSYPVVITAIATCLPNNCVDPWGNAYICLNIINGGSEIEAHVSEDKKLNPISSLYDLYSIGKDGKTQKRLDNKDSVDDIVMASDGAFVGLPRIFN